MPPQTSSLHLSPRRILSGLLLAAVLTSGAVGLSSCATQGAVAQQDEPAGSTSAAATDPSATTVENGPAPAAPVGTPAQSTRVRFIPDQVVLPGGASAKVAPASTVDGELKVPENVKHVGWWDGSAYAGDPFGNTVIAGHVDSATDGLGFFARLRTVTKGETVTLHGDGHQLSYRITAVKTIKKGALATGSSTFDQDGDPHLELITCGGAYLRGQGGYDSNVVVTAVPLGLAR